ncbi:sulfotransferase [Fodinibius halophilus]|uniref:Sulfotransferase n=1 Tax=Fodinibius halophilus TaxID=1736908 RepID=A0A6M1TIA5_9BACT|nr:sulfotransferase [Fodinibius halophilus]NGP89792.1 sulfotransferase [Fodinibius halophilus]
MVFILGIERSATTWVSNILDMHSGTELYMEPLSERTSRFKQWPNRFTKIEDLPGRAQYFQEEFTYLRERNKFFFSRLSDADLAWQLDFLIAEKLWRALPLARDFFELNFNRKGTREYPSKRISTVDIIKEVRLNFNTSILKYIHPNIKVVVVLRNYAANVQSVARQISKGNLSELAELLQNHFHDINEQTIFDYWANSYNHLLKDLDEEKISYFVLRQKDLIQSGEETIDDLLSFLELSPEPSVYNYISRSNVSGAGKHNTKRSHNKILEQNSQAQNKLYPKIAEQIDTTDWHPVLHKEIIKL